MTVDQLWPTTIPIPSGSVSTDAPEVDEVIPDLGLVVPLTDIAPARGTRSPRGGLLWGIDGVEEPVNGVANSAHDGMLTLLWARSLH